LDHRGRLAVSQNQKEQCFHRATALQKDGSDAFQDDPQEPQGLVGSCQEHESATRGKLVLGNEGLRLDLKKDASSYLEARANNGSVDTEGVPANYSSKTMTDRDAMFDCARIDELGGIV
jgi:hypothetical protein